MHGINKVLKEIPILAILSLFFQKLQLLHRPFFAKHVVIDHFKIVLYIIDARIYEEATLAILVYSPL
jgi:hypothetical protein